MKVLFTEVRNPFNPQYFAIKLNFYFQTGTASNTSVSYEINCIQFVDMPIFVCTFLISFLLPSWRAVQFYRPHLEERDPIWRNGTPFGGKGPHLEERDSIWRKGTPFGGKGPHLEEMDPIWRKGTPLGGMGPHLEERDPMWRKGTPFGGKGPHLEERDLIWRKGTPFGGMGPNL